MEVGCFLIEGDYFGRTTLSVPDFKNSNHMIGMIPKSVMSWRVAFHEIKLNGYNFEIHSAHDIS